MPVPTRRPALTVAAALACVALLVYAAVGGGFDGVFRSSPIGLGGAGAQSSSGAGSSNVTGAESRADVDLVDAADATPARDPEPQLAPLPEDDDPNRAPGRGAGGGATGATGANPPTPGATLGSSADVAALRRSPTHAADAADLVVALELSPHLTDPLADVIEDWVCAQAEAHFAESDDRPGLRRAADQRREADVRALFAEPQDAAPVLRWIDGNVRIPQRR